MCVAVAREWCSSRHMSVSEDEDIIFHRIIEYARHDYRDGDRHVDITLDFFVENRGSPDTHANVLFVHVGAVTPECRTGQWTGHADDEYDLYTRALRFHPDWRHDPDGVVWCGGPKFTFLDCAPSCFGVGDGERPFSLMSFGPLSHKASLCRIGFRIEGTTFDRLLGDRPRFTICGAEVILRTIESDNLPSFCQDADAKRLVYEREFDRFRTAYEETRTPCVYEIALYARDSASLPILAGLPDEITRLHSDDEGFEKSTIWLTTPEVSGFAVSGTVSAGNFAFALC